VPNYLVQAILCTIVFNVLAGVVAIVYSVQVNRKLTAGDWDGAARASRLARTWCWVSVVVGVVFLTLILSGIVPNPYAA
jgi:Interferon-induced transmembrane protein